MDELFDRTTPSNTHLSDEDIKVEDLNHVQTSNATFENVVKTKACCSSTQDIVRVENLKETHDDIPDGSVKIKEKIKPENSCETFVPSNFNMKDILKTEIPCDTQIPYTAKLERVIKDGNLHSIHLQYSETNIKLEVNIEGDNSPKNQTSFNDIKVKVEENMPAESLHDTRVDVKCENGMETEAAPSLISQFVKVEENYNTSCAESILLTGSGPQVSTAYPESGQGDHIVNGRDDSPNEEPQIEVDVNEASESYWEFPTSSDNSIQEKGPAPSTIDPECQNISNEKLDSWEDINTHIKKARGTGFGCSTCGKVFSSRNKLQNHNRTNSGEKPYQCEFCCKSFSRKSDMERHIRIHNGEKSYKCEICCKSFSLKYNMERHKSIHSKEKPYQCEFCFKTFSQKYNMDLHKRTHSGEKPYQCEICCKRFSQKAHVESHKRTNHGSYQCEICCKRFSQKSDMEIHKRTHSGEKPYQCEICYKRMSNKLHMESHKRTHSGEKPYQCEICCKRFSQKSNMKIHKRTHSGEKPYQCEICDKRFSHKSHMESHKRAHSGEKPYQCEICYRRFSHKSHMESHKRVHNGEKL